MTRRLPPLPLRRGVKRDPFDLIGAANPAPQCPAINYRFGRVDRCTSDAEPLHDLHSASGYDPVDGEVYGVAWLERRALPSGATHRPCCSSHGVDMTCERYRRAHFVEVRPCCAVDARRLKEQGS